MATNQDNFADTSKLNELLQSEVSGGVLQNEETSPDVYDTESRTTSDNLLSEVSTLQNFKYTTAKKPGDTNGRAQFSSDYSTERENVYAFDGSNDHIDVPTDSTLDTLEDTFTVSFWLKMEDPTDWKGIITHCPTGLATGWFITNGAGDPTLRVYEGTYRSFGLDATPGVWEHWVMSIGTTSGVAYKNGQAGPSFTWSSRNDDGIGIGLGTLVADTTNRPLWGGLAEVKIYNKEVSADEALYIYTNGAEGTDPTTTDLISYWKIDEGSGTTIADSAGSNTGTGDASDNWGTDTDFAHKIANWTNKDGNNLDEIGAYEFDGVDDNIAIPDDDSLSFVSEPMTVTAWVNMDDDDGFRIFEKYTGVNNAEYQFDTGGADKLQVYLFSAATANFISSIADNEFFTDYQTNTWHHVAFTYDGGTSNTGLNLYIDGLLIDQTKGSGGSFTGMTNTTNELTIGGDAALSYADGKISDVRVYREELSQTDLWNLYAHSIEPDDTNLEGHWKFNGNALDSTSNDNDGTVTGAINTTDWNGLPQVGQSLLGRDVRNVLSFDGVDDFASMGNIAPPTDISGFAWFNTSDITNDNRIISYRLSGSTYTILRTSGSKLQYLFSGELWTAPDDLPQDVWVHVGFTQTGSNDPKVYVNGIDVSATGSGSATRNTTSQLFKIGGDSSGNYTEGIISDVKIYDTELSAANALGVFDGTFTSTTNLVHHYEMNEGAGNFIIDDGSNGNDGSITSATWTKDAIDNSYNVPSFDGVDDEVTASPAITSGTVFSASFWVTSGVTVTNKSVWDTRTSGALNGFAVFIGSTGLVNLFTTGGSTRTSSGSVDDGKWHHIVVTNDGSTSNIYIDGALDKTQSSTFDGFSGSSQTLFGVFFNGTGFLPGNVANAAIYDDVLGLGEVEKLYERGWVDTNDDNLISYWPLNGDYNDKKGTNHGTNDGTTFIKDLYRPMAEFPITEENLLSFDGSNDYVDIDDTTSKPDAFTVMAWVKTSDTAFGELIGWQSSGSYPKIDLNGATGRALVYFGNANFRYFDATDTILEDGNWHHVAFTMPGAAQTDITNCNYYLDGVSQSVNLTFSSGAQTAKNTALIGKNSTSQYFKGQMAEFKMYDDVLTADEIVHAYTNGSDGTDPGTDNLVGYWKLDEGTGTTATDSSSSSNDGTITGASWTTGTPHFIFDGTNGTQYSIDLSALGEQDEIYYRTFFEGETDRTYALDEVTIEYTVDTGTIVLPDTVTIVTSVNTPTFMFDFVMSPEQVSLAASVNAPIVSVPVTLFPEVLELVASVGMPTVSTGGVYIWFNGTTNRLEFFVNNEEVMSFG